MSKRRKLLIAAAATAAGAAGASLLLRRPAAGKKPAQPQLRGSHTSKILHQSGCRFYDSVKLAQVFKSVPNAIDAGYRPCKICLP